MEEARFGNYRITGTLGSGAISTIYRAVQEPIGRTVALKALKSQIAPTSSFGDQLENPRGPGGLFDWPERGDGSAAIRDDDPLPGLRAAQVPAQSRLELAHADDLHGVLHDVVTRLP